MTDAKTALQPCQLHLSAPGRGEVTLRCSCGFEREFVAPVGFGTVGWYATQHRMEMAENAASQSVECAHGWSVIPGEGCPEDPGCNTTAKDD